MRGLLLQVSIAVMLAPVTFLGHISSRPVATMAEMETDKVLGPPKPPTLHLSWSLHAWQPPGVGACTLVLCLAQLRADDLAAFSWGWPLQPASVLARAPPLLPC